MYQTTLEKIKNSHIVFFGFDPSSSDSSNQWYRRFCILTSDDGVNFELIKYFPDINLSDVDVLENDGTWYLLGTNTFYKTTDFETMTQIDMPLTSSNLTNYNVVWAPQFCKNYTDDTWHIVYYAQKTDGSGGMYLADFDPDAGTISNLSQAVDSPAGGHIDPDICYFNEKYYMWTSGPHLYVSDSLVGPYTETATNIDTKFKTAKWYEGPYMMFANGTAYLFQDKITGIMPGVGDSGYMVLRTANVDDLSTWSDEMIVKAPLNIRHGCFKVIRKKFNSEIISDTIFETGPSNFVAQHSSAQMNSSSSSTTTNDDFVDVNDSDWTTVLENGE